jgi:hypothetical protein
VRVITDRAEYEADSLVIAGGAWNSRLLPFLQGMAVPERQVLAWLQPDRPEYFTPATFPVFNVLVPEGRYYGFPVHTVPGFKFGRYHHFEEVVEPDTYDRQPSEFDEEVLRDFASRYFPDGAGPTMILKSCMFTNSPDRQFIIDLHPEYPQVSFAAGFSGHGYKFASVIGEVMADLAERQDSRHNISLFNIARLTGKVSKLYQNIPGMRVSAGNRIQPQPQSRIALPNRRITRGGRRLTTPRNISTPRRIHQENQTPRRAHGEYYHDSTDPRYWESEDVKPFW